MASFSQIVPSEVTELTPTWVKVYGNDLPATGSWIIGEDRYPMQVIVEGDDRVSLLIPPLPFGEYTLSVEASGESFSLADAFRVVTNTNTELYDYIIDAVREDDRIDGDSFLQRYLRGAQSLVDVMKEKIDELPFSIGPGTVSEREAKKILPQIGKLVALGTPDLAPVMEALDIPRMRKLVAAASTIWSQMLTEVGYKNACRIITGDEVVIYNWFLNRVVLGETPISFNHGHAGGEFKLHPGLYDTGEGDEANGPYQSDLYMWTPEIEDADVEILRLILRLMRPMSERLNLYFCEVFDEFLLGQRQWLEIGGDLVEFYPGEGMVQIGGSLLQAGGIAVGGYDYLKRMFESNFYFHSDILIPKSTSTAIAFGTGDGTITHTYQLRVGFDLGSRTGKRRIDLMRHYNEEGGPSSTTFLEHVDVPVSEECTNNLAIEQRIVATGGGYNRELRCFLNGEHLMTGVESASQLDFDAAPSIIVPCVTTGFEQVELYRTEAHYVPRRKALVDINE